MEADGSLKQFTNVAILFKMALLIPPMTSNVKRGFSVMNLICLWLRTSLSKANLDCFILICINGPETFKNSDAKKMVDKNLTHKFQSLV